ncbi:MAG: molecular chaperone DnaJ [Leptospiraceae bacterium]|nr:molecular chaperone DnaJ [Leptospiraceae bacterium]MCK6380260.1 molecular chaperone DnaJ [Leptospiraceae bacterium]NUM40896.1 molecular chaperone DnaJ [Leptospiraceae bacterium]
MENYNFIDAVLFFGLEKNFSRKEFQKAYHALSMKYHPDRGEFTSDVLFIELVKYREVIEEYLENRENLDSKSIKNSKDYQIYREAKFIENESILNYFKKRDGLKISLKENENPELKILKTKLNSAKEKYEEILSNYPKSIWLEDSKNSIQRIEIWFH